MPSLPSMDPISLEISAEINSFLFFRLWLLAVAFHRSSTEVLGAGISRCIAVLFALALTIHPYLLSSTEAEVFVALTSRTMQVCALVLEED